MGRLDMHSTEDVGGESLLCLWLLESLLPGGGGEVAALGPVGQETEDVAEIGRTTPGFCTMICQTSEDCPAGPEGEPAVCVEIGKAQVCSTE